MPNDDPTVSRDGAADALGGAQASGEAIVQIQGDRFDLITSAQGLVGARYQLQGLLGRGGMGRVYAAFDQLLHRRVAIKVLGPHAGKQPDRLVHERERSRLIDEARAMARMNHPNLCRVLEVAIDGPVPFIVMDLIDGIDLRTAWRGEARPQRLKSFVKIVEAIAVAHDSGLVHRDLKPNNILVDRNGEPIVVDFGLALSTVGSNAWAPLGGGTPGHAAPEQFSGDQPVGAQADVYGLGVILFELLTDRMPFSGSTASEIVERVRSQDPPLPEKYEPMVSASLQRICLSALERDPAQRYPDAGTLLADLRRHFRGEEVAARPTVFAGQFGAQVDEAIVRANLWTRRGLITEREREALVGIFTDVLRPESHWIIDARRLTPSQVALYLGGWFVILALSVGLWFSWDSLAPWIRQAGPWFVAILLLGTGLTLQKTGRDRVATGYLVVASLVVPLSTWILLRENERWAPNRFSTQGPTQWLGLLFGQTPAGLSNAQTLIIAVVWFACAAALRAVTRSSTFTLFCVLSAACVWCAEWVNSDRLSALNRVVGAEFGAWLAVFGFLSLPLGLALNRREESLAESVGRAKVRRRDSHSVLVGSSLALFLGLTALAFLGPEYYRFAVIPMSPAGQPPPPTVALVSTAIIINGALLQALSVLLGHRTTILRRRLSSWIRWVIPSHFLASLLALEINDSAGLWMLWSVLLASAAVCLCFLSVVWQWKPFVYTSLPYLLICYVRVFGRLEAEFQDPRPARLLLTLGALFVGLAIMFLSWKVPDWLASRRAAG